MSKVKQYIEDAVKATASEIKTKGVEVSDVSIDMPTHIHIDNGDLTCVLLELAKAQSEIASAVVAISKTKPTIENNSTGLSFHGVGNKPTQFTES